MPEFVACRLSESNVLFPDKIKIDAVNVTYYKGTLVGYRTMVISRGSISSVRINKGLLFADIVIESKGGGLIVASGFTRSDAKEILRILT